MLSLRSVLALIACFALGGNAARAESKAPAAEAQLPHTLTNAFTFRGGIALPLLPAGELALDSVGNAISAGCVDIESYGGSTAISDNTSALVNAVAASTSLSTTNGACVQFGLGNYNFSQKVSLSLPNRSFGLTIRGKGETTTKLTWTAKTDGIYITEPSDQNTVHVQELSLLTATTGGTGVAVGNNAAGGSSLTHALTIFNTNVQGKVAISDVTHVTIKGSDGGQATNYWGMGIFVHLAGYINFVSNTFEGSASNYGIGVLVEGDWQQTGTGSNGANNYGVIYNFYGNNFMFLDQGFAYGSYVQGVTLTGGNNWVGGNTCIAANEPTSTGTLAQLTVTGNQFGGCANAAIKELGVNVADQTMIGDNLIFVPAGANGIDFGNGTYFFSAHDNLITGAGTGSTTNLIVVSKTNNGTTAVHHNHLYAAGTAVLLGSTSANVQVADNVYGLGAIANTNNVVDQGSNNLVDQFTTVNGLPVKNFAYGGSFGGTLSTAKTITAAQGITGGSLASSAGVSGLSHVANGAPTAYWGFDATGAAAVTVANGASVSLPAGRGLVTVSNNVDGNNCAFLTGNGASVLLGQVGTSCSNAAASGKVSLTYSGGASGSYALNNGLSSAANFSIGGLRNSTAN